MIRRLTAHPLLRAAAPALVVALGIASLTVLFAWGDGIYFRLRVAAGMKPYEPFLDLHAVMAAIECWHRGVDVYASNPCDEYGRLHIYSPLLLRLPAAFGDPALRLPLGVGFALGFAASLLWLPPAPRGGLPALLLATAAPVTAFALERANFDLLVFMLVVPGAVLLAHGQAARILGFALFVVAGLLKFYPLVLLLLLVRERPPVMFALLLVAAAILRATLGTIIDETRHAIDLIPVQAVFWGSFAAHNLPRGLMALTASPAAGALALAAGLATAALAAWRALRGPGLAAGLWALPPVTRSLLLASATLVAGCFLAGENIEYRAILVLPALPALLALPATRHAGWLVAALMWHPLAQRLAAHLAPPEGGQPSLPGLALWAAYNLAWWWLAAVLVTVALLLLRDAPGLALLRPWATARRGGR